MIWRIFAPVVSRCELDLWPWPLTLKMCGRLRVMWSNYVQIWSRSINPRMRYWRFSQFFSRGWIFKLYSLDGVSQTAPDLGRTEFHHRRTKYDTLVAMRSFVSKGGPLKQELVSKIEAKFHTFWLPVKISGGVGRMLIEYTLRPNLTWYTFDGQPLRGVEV